MDELAQIKRDLAELNEEIYRNNFTSHQDFNKRVHFNDRIKVPVVTALPSTCEVGELIVYSGKLYVASAANTWTIAGTQS